LNVKRGRFDYPTLRNTAVALAEIYKPEVILIEDATTGTSLVQELKQRGDFNVRPVKIEQDKQGRLWVQQAKFEAGLIHFPRRATWLGELETELFRFPQAKYDDQVDSISQALAYKVEYDSTMAWADHLVNLLPDRGKIMWMYR
jgi:predicted phage terminase large subunit-like protein